LPKDDIDEIKEDAQTVVTCEFCSARYVFSPADLDAALERRR
jgi:redox-regulated HSP33 family molecular chaperone